MTQDGLDSDTGVVRVRNFMVAAVVLSLVVFGACLIGIYSRLPGTLAVFWPANALLLGLLVRNPRWATAAWLGGPVGYVGADLLTGSPVNSALLLNAANMLGIVVAFYLFRGASPADRALDRAFSVTFLSAIATVAAAAAAVLGGAINVVMFDGTWAAGWLDWFSLELVNYMVLLPVILTFPAQPLARAIAERRVEHLRDGIYRQLRRSILPAAMLSVSLILAWLMGGFGAIAVTMPALVAAALLTNVFMTSLFVMTSTAWSLALTVEGRLGITDNAGIPVTSSTQIGLALLAVGPLAVACAWAERERSRLALVHAMTLDDLTGAYRRGEFLRRAEAEVSTASRAGQPSSMLMMDLDHFKRLNDSLGHHAGDRALVDFAHVVRTNLGPRDIFARLGGEEFAVLMPGIDGEGATLAAEKIRADQEGLAQAAFGDLGPTVSIGLSCSNGCGDELTQLLKSADTALYRAKETNRNRVVSDMASAPEKS